LQETNPQLVRICEIFNIALSTKNVRLFTIKNNW